MIRTLKKDRVGCGHRCFQGKPGVNKRKGHCLKTTDLTHGTGGNFDELPRQKMPALLVKKPPIDRR
jgi:hypothetical protein